MLCPLCLLPRSVMDRSPSISPISTKLHDAIAALLVAKKAANKRPKYVTNLKQYLGAFANDRGDISVANVDVQMIEAWLSVRHGTPSSRATGINRIRTLLSFAKRRGWISENPCDRLERVTVEPEAPQILTVAQCRRLLLACCSALRPWVVLCLFVGLRPAEAERLDWSAVRIKDRRVVVDAAASKVRRRRIIPILETAARWLSLDAQEAGPVVSSHSTLRRRRREAARASEIDWSQDVLRHSFGSYALGAGHGTNTVADWMGNSPRILLSHYRELVTPEDAAEFWELKP